MFRDGLWMFWLLPVLIGLMIWAAVVDHREWSQFKAQHHCVIVGKMTGDVFNTVTVSGNGQVGVGVGSTPDKTGWKCDDGVTYWR